MKTNEIRQMWIDFFLEKEHYLEPARSLVPVDDDSLLFINSGVATLKKYFDGTQKPMSPRLVNAQRSLRTNDIENVGITSRHHTLFEMLGNFSIGDYFKEEAIEIGFELITSEKWFAMPLDKLYFTVHPNDTVAYDKWVSLGIDPSHIVKLTENFWEIGEGPGGPNTEIFYDRGSAYDQRDVITLLTDDLENDRIIEIWNIVFSEYNCMPGVKPQSEYEELPQQNIDTGMGLERMACILQDVPTNFETDNFIVIIEEIEKLTAESYANNKKPFRIISDHIRALVFAISDGIVPANDGRGYVLRRILRRAVKSAYIELGIKEPFLQQLVDVVIEINKDFYPELETSSDRIKEVITNEEIKFLDTIDEGMKLCNQIIADRHQISGDDAFMLYDTYGFPVEITEEIGVENNVTVDIEGFHQAMEKQKQRARASVKSHGGMSIQNELLQNIEDASEFVGYSRLAVLANISKIIDNNVFVDNANSGQVGIILDKSPFYAESGGQVSDGGFIGNNHVVAVNKLPGGQHLHIVDIVNPIAVNDQLLAQVDVEKRKKITANHSATHLLHLALRNLLGDVVTQQGSFQDELKTRFDYSTARALEESELENIQAEVNKRIRAGVVLDIREMPIDEARNLGAVALFGEKYGDVVRVVQMGDSIELCGGTHVTNTREINGFYIVSETGIGSGIRRIEAVTAGNLQIFENELINDIKSQVVNFTNKLTTGEVIKMKNLHSLASKLPRLSQATGRDYKILFDALDALEKKNEENKLKVQAETVDQGHDLKAEILYSKVEEDGVNFFTFQGENINFADLRNISDQIINEYENTNLIFKVINNGKIQVLVRSSKTISEKYPANQIINQILGEYGGKGGGNPEMAQGGASL